MSEVAVIVVNYRTPELTIRCVEALMAERTQLKQLRAVVVDGSSGDDSRVKLARFLGRAEFKEWVSFMPLAINGGFGWANNQAILELARGSRPPDFVYLLNPDAEITAGAVISLLEELQKYPRCGAAGSRLLTCDGRTAASAFRFPSPGRELVGAAQSEQLRRMLSIRSIVVTAEESLEVDWVTGASVMLRAGALRQTGLFDDGFFLYFEEVELMHRLHKSGWTIRHVPASCVTHIEGASTGIGAATANRQYPAYWYQSRRRYFGLTAGSAGVVAANCALLGGEAIAAAKRLVRRSADGIASRTGQVLAQGFCATHFDLTPSRPSWGDPPGRPPAWMGR